MDLFASWPEVQRLLGLSDYNTRVVLLGSALLGVVSGVMGSFMMLRRKAMISDVVSHAALPGIVAAFMITAGLPGGGKQLPWLLAGALASGCLGMACVHAIRTRSHIKEDAALGIVLSVFFGLGVVLLGFAQRMKAGSAAGLESFIYGKTASMLAFDAWLMGWSALVVGATCLVLYKEFRLVCFDPEFARTQGWPVQRLDALLTLLVVVVTVIGLQAVGLILMIAMLITPPAAARFWTDRLGVMITLSAVIGGASAVLGASLSAVLPRLPAGAMIVLSCSAFFLAGLLFGTRRGVIPHYVHQVRLARRVDRHHLLRALYEQVEHAIPRELAATWPAPLVNGQSVAAARGWSEARMQGLVRAAAADGEVELDAWPLVRLTEKGLAHARQVVRNHRLWEWYLIQHAEVDSTHVDRDADEIEHVLGARLVRELEETLAGAFPGRRIPESPHPIDGVGRPEARS